MVWVLIMNESKRIEELKETISTLKEELTQLRKEFDNHINDNHADKKPYWFDEC